MYCILIPSLVWLLVELVFVIQEIKYWNLKIKRFDEKEGEK